MITLSELMARPVEEEKCCKCGESICWLPDAVRSLQKRRQKELFAGIAQQPEKCQQVE